MSNYSEYSDVELIGLLTSNGDFNGAFTVIYDRYFPPLVLFADRMLGDMDLAQDIVQEIFTKLFQQREEIHINTSLKSYLYKAVRNGVFDNLKHAKVEINYAEVYAYTKESAELADQQVCLKELIRIIDEEIEKMPAQMRNIFELSRKQFLSQRDIAQLLNLSLSTVNKQIYRALKKLHKSRLLYT